MIYLYVAIGGALGSVARYWLNNLVGAMVGLKFPWGILLINVIGSFVIGLFGTFTLESRHLDVPSDLRVFVMVGLCGGFTTFSSFSLQTVELARNGEWNFASLYVGASVALCLLACWAGILSALALEFRQG